MILQDRLQWLLPVLVPCWETHIPDPPALSLKLTLPFAAALPNVLGTQALPFSIVTLHEPLSCPMALYPMDNWSASAQGTLDDPSNIIPEKLLGRGYGASVGIRVPSFTIQAILQRPPNFSITHCPHLPSGHRWRQNAWCQGHHAVNELHSSGGATDMTHTDTRAQGGPEFDGAST